MSDTIPTGAIIFDRAAVRAHRKRAASRLEPVRTVLDDLAARVLDRLDDTSRRFNMALDLGGRGAVAPLLAARGMTVISADLSASMAAHGGGIALAADEEALPFANKSFDLIVAHLVLHWVNDLPGALIQLRRALKPDGLFIASLPLTGTLASLRTALVETESVLAAGTAPRMSPLADLSDCMALMQRAGFTMPVAEAEEITLMYRNRLALLRDLQASGESNALVSRSRMMPPRLLFPSALARIDPGAERIGARLRMGILTGWGPALTTNPAASS
jgi:NADH dehydrogenase [ubiquinone] 1 alpha subcomplex assembly factor 5